MAAKTKILIVEDDMVIAKHLEQTLMNKGYNDINIVTSGDDAINFSEKESPDLVLMDIVLKGKMNGIDATKKIKQKKNIPIIFLTAHSDPHTFKEAVGTDPFCYLVKPFKEEELEQYVESALFQKLIKS